MTQTLADFTTGVTPA